MGVLKFSISYHSFLILLRFEEISYYLSRSLYSLQALGGIHFRFASLWDFPTTSPGNTNKLFLARIPFIMATLHFYWYYLVQCSQTKGVMPKKLQCCYIIELIDFYQSNSISGEGKHFCIHLSNAAQSVECCSTGLLGCSSFWFIILYFILYSMQVLSYVVVEFIAMYFERTDSVSQLGDLANGRVTTVFMNILCTRKAKGWILYHFTLRL